MVTYPDTSPAYQPAYPGLALPDSTSSSKTQLNDPTELPVSSLQDIIMATHMSKMKNNAIVGNIGNFDNEIDMAGLLGWQGIKRQNIKPQCDR